MFQKATSAPMPERETRLQGKGGKLEGKGAPARERLSAKEERGEKGDRSFLLLSTHKGPKRGATDYSEKKNGCA